MTEIPRPATLGEILDRTAHIYRTRFLIFVGVALPPAGVILFGAGGSVLFLTWLGTAGKSAPPATAGILAVLFSLGLTIFLPLCVGVVGLGAGALNHAAAAAFDNRSITIRGAYQAAWKRGWHYIWLLVLEGLILLIAPAAVCTGLILLAAVGMAMIGRSAAGAVTAGTSAVLLGLPALAIYALCMLLMLCLSFPACVVENVSAWTAVKRAIFLSKGTRLRILVLYILGMLLRWGISMVLMIPVILVVTLVPGLDTPRHSRILGTVMVMMIYGSGFMVRAFTRPIYTIAQMLFYYDQRIRKEGFDIVWMMRQAGMVEAPAPQPAAAPWMPPVGAVTALPVPDPDGVPAAASAPGVDLARSADVEPASIAGAESLQSNVLPTPGDLA
jgi:hypothetical protein